MALEAGEKVYISWGDVSELTRYLEAGYGGRIAFKMVIACPKGEKQLLQYWEAHWCDDALQERAISTRCLTRFPSVRGQSLAAALVGLLYQLDNILGKEAVWAEPQIAVKPRVGGH